MNTVLIIGLTVMSGSLALLGLTLAKRQGNWRRAVIGDLAVVMLGFAIVSQALIPQSIVGAITSLVFIASAIYLTVLEIRIGRSNA
jgi:ABC-type uncharacterized transport system permease subunit